MQPFAPQLLNQLGPGSSVFDQNDAGFEPRRTLLDRAFKLGELKPLAEYVEQVYLLGPNAPSRANTVIISSLTLFDRSCGEQSPVVTYEHDVAPRAADGLILRFRLSCFPPVKIHL